MGMEVKIWLMIFLLWMFFVLVLKVRSMWWWSMRWCSLWMFLGSMCEWFFSSVSVLDVCRNVMFVCGFVLYLMKCVWFLLM